MTTTTPKVTFGLYALTIKQDSTPACSDVQTFSKVNDLKTGNVSGRPIITYEPNYWLLDGGYKFKPAVDAMVHVGLFSLSMSNGTGVFAVPPVLTITFGSVQTADGLTIRFSQKSNDYANNIVVAYYDQSNAVIRSDSYAPTSWEFSTGQAVANFKKIIITFNGTNKPNRYLRVTGIDYGELIYFIGEEIKSASVVQEVNPLSIELPIDTLDLSLFSTNADFSIINPTGNYAALQEKQPIDVYEEVDGASVYIGQFYLDEWENPSNNEIRFKAIDRLGILDGLTYVGGIWITPTNVETIIDAMLTEVNAPYELDTTLYGTTITGWIPICTYREALQLIAFTIGAYVTCSRAGILRIIKTTLASELTGYETEITAAQKGMDQSLTLKPLVTGVEVTAYNYVTNTTSTQLFNGTLAIGQHTITFNEPKHDLSVSGATIVESGANYAVLNVTAAGTVTLSGQGYTETQKVNGVYNTTLDANTPKNVLSIQDVTLVNPTNVGTITQRVYDYYQQRYLQKVKLYAPTAEPGRGVLIDSLYNNQIAGVVEKMDLDLTGGFTSKTEIVGVIA